MPPEPGRLRPSGGQTERDAAGKETGYARVPLKWFVDVFIVNDEERAWRNAAQACLEVRQ